MFRSITIIFKQRINRLIMTKIIESLQVASVCSVIAVGAVVATILAPVVSLVAVPIFALKALPQWIEHRSLYNRTLTDGTRAKFGRIEGQDYTRWDGKAITQEKTNPTWQERMHELMDAYVHGQKDASFSYHFEQAEDCPLQTKEDLNWLKREFTRREKKDRLDSDLKMLRAFSKALILIAGVIWVLFSETAIGGASQMGCPVCMLGGDSEDTHWNWKEAILFHKKALSQKLKNS